MKKCGWCLEIDVPLDVNFCITCKTVALSRHDAMVDEVKQQEVFNEALQILSTKK